MTAETSFGLAFVMLAQKPHALLLSRQWKFTRYLKKTVKFKIMQTLEKLFFYENMKNKAPKFIWSYAVYLFLCSGCKFEYLGKAE